MTDYTVDSGLVGRHYCPACEPEADEGAEVLTVRFCVEHAPTCEGPDDERLRLTIQGPSGDAEGADCRTFATWLAGRR